MPPVKQTSETKATETVSESSVIREVPLASCKEIILKHHYSHRLPGAVTLCFADIEYEPVRRTLACVMFGWALGRSEESMWELTRLVRLPEYDKPLTKLIAKAMGHIRQHKLIDLVCSFADSEEDHHGGIYQACSWAYSGDSRSREVDGFNIDGVFVPARTANSRYGTSSVEGLQKLLKGKHEVTPHYAPGKHHYWKALTKEGMKKAIRAGFASHPYPKPMIVNGLEANVVFKAGHERKGVIDIRQARESANGETEVVERVAPRKSLLKK